MQFTAIVSKVSNSALSFFKLKYAFDNDLHGLLRSQYFVTIIKHKVAVLPVPLLKINFFLSFFSSFLSLASSLLSFVFLTALLMPQKGLF